MMSSISPSMVSPPPALAASHVRRQRSNAISRARESEEEWDPASAPAYTSPEADSPSPSLWHDDELICPLALDTQQHAHSKAPLGIPVPIWPSNEGELQAVLAQFTFPTVTSGRKHRRSGEMITDNSPPGSASPADASAASSGKRRASSGPIRRAWCPHCERGRSSA
jgi:hypothetical protein